MARQTKWYPDAYTEAMMQRCPRGCEEIETQAHMLPCARGSAVQMPSQEELRQRWGPQLSRVAAEYAFRLTPSLQITDEWQLATKEALKRDKRQQQQTKDKQWRDPRKLKTAMQMQVTERIEFLYVQWKERNDMQIHREDTTAVRARRRREIMRQSRTSGRSRDNRTAVVPPIAGSR
ncbi:hypothetical protein BX070DRAFT_255234 [Coemansia spiralis]|nr:hypothetical protein BX070DRAFT_255234 [Coemansia spiralis]